MEVAAAANLGEEEEVEVAVGAAKQLRGAIRITSMRRSLMTTLTRSRMARHLGRTTKLMTRAMTKASTRVVTEAMTSRMTSTRRLAMTRAMTSLMKRLAHGGMLLLGTTTGGERAVSVAVVTHLQLEVATWQS